MIESGSKIKVLAYGWDHRPASQAHLVAFYPISRPRIQRELFNVGFRNPDDNSERRTVHQPAPLAKKKAAF